MKLFHNSNHLLTNNMNFTANTNKAVDFSKIEVNTVANATLKSFSYRSGYCFATLIADGETVNAIIGSQQDYPISAVLPLKGLEVEVTFLGTRVNNGVTYPKYSINW